MVLGGFGWAISGNWDSGVATGGEERGRLFRVPEKFEFCVGDLDSRRGSV